MRARRSTLLVSISLLFSCSPPSNNDTDSGTPADAGALVDAGQPPDAGAQLDAGEPAGCTDASTCPGVDDECQTRICEAGHCGFDYRPGGQATATQTDGNCHTQRCDGAGNANDVVDDSDQPVDGNPCTDDLCTNGVGSNPVLTGTACNHNSGSVCSSDGTGLCVECNIASTCPGTDTLCHYRACEQHSCAAVDAPNNLEVGPQTANDCLKNVCDGFGQRVSRADDTDLPGDDGNACTAEVCSNGVASYDAALKNGATCSGTQGGRCGAGACVPTFMVVHVGSGAGFLDSATAPVVVERRYFDTGGAIVPLNGTVSLPTTASGAQQPFTLGGSVSGEGNLSLSENGKYVALAGYAVGTGIGGSTNPATPGQQCASGAAFCASIAGTSSSVVSRVVARIDATGAVDTSTTLSTAFDLGSVRGATSVDGTSFWVTGAGTNAGVQYSTLGSSSSVQILATPFATRTVEVIGGQLYGSSNSIPHANLFAVGSGTPTAAASSAVTPFSGMPTTSAGGSPQQFVLFDLDSVPGIDTAYVADDRPALAGGGISRWTFDGLDWIKDATFTDGLAAASGSVRGLTGMVKGGDVTLLATTANVNSGNKIVMYVDVGGMSTNPTATVLSNATAAANTAFRGLSLAP